MLRWFHKQVPVPCQRSVIGPQTTVGFVSRPVQSPDQLGVGSPNRDLYVSMQRFRQDLFNPSVLIPGSAFLVSHLRPHSDKLLIIIEHCQRSILVDFGCIARLRDHDEQTPAPDHILKVRVNDCWLCILVDLEGIWLHTGIKIVLAGGIAKRESKMLLAPLWK